MTTDLFGKPLGQRPAYVLDLHQKRQATLLYHWMSLDYLRGLKGLIDALIQGADVNLELAKRQGRDALIANERWGVRDTAANWSTHVFPALEDFRKATIRDIALRATESYEFTGANQCAHMIDEFSSLWMTEEEEEHFKKQFKAVYSYASHIDFAAGVGGLRHQLDDLSMNRRWFEFSGVIPKMPRFHVRTDVQGESGKRPPRTGVYVAQDDHYATLQFAWTGNSDGVLGDAQTLNDVGRRAMAALGRDGIWANQSPATVAYVVERFRLGELTERGGFDVGDEADPDLAARILIINSRTARPCKWYLVERVEGELEEDDVQNAQVGLTPSHGLRVEGGQRCIKSGYWFTPARENSRSYFEAGALMPSVGGDYGSTIWQWDEDQTP